MVTFANIRVFTTIRQPLDSIIRVSCVKFHEEFNGATPGAVKVGIKKLTQKKLKNPA